MCALVCQGRAESEEVSKDMSKERSSALGMEGRGGSSVKGGGDGSQFRDGSESKKRLDDVVEKPSPSTSKGGIGKEKERFRNNGLPSSFIHEYAICQHLRFPTMRTNSVENRNLPAGETTNNCPSKEKNQ